MAKGILLSLEVRPSEIAAYYKKRWSIELLFKWLKQNLSINKFVGENENAIKTQIYSAIIVYIIIDMLKNMQVTGFTRCVDIMSWIKINIVSTGIKIKPPNTPASVCAYSQPMVSTV
jgi:Transposase DDE domain